MPWSQAPAELYRAVVAVGIAVAVSAISWQYVGKPNARETREQAAALAAQSETRATLAAFVAARPAEVGTIQQATDLYRTGRRLNLQGEFGKAIQRFGDAQTLLETACPDCPAVDLTP